MKKIYVLILSLLCLVSFSACGSVDTASMNFESVVTEMTELMYSGDYDAAAEYISDSAPQDLDASALESIALGTQEAYGSYVGISGLEQSSIAAYVASMELTEKVNPADYDEIVYFMGVAFEQSEMGFFVMLDPDDRGVVNITVVGLESRPAESIEE